MCKKFLMTFVILAGWGSSLFASLEWTTDYQKALEKSQQEEKPLLLFFTGSDWSGWGMKMRKEILDSPEFVQKIAEDFICVEIDFPLRKKLSENESLQNQRLKEKLEISEYPRLVILDRTEREIARLGYSDEEGGKFAEDLINIFEKDRSFTQLMRQLFSSSHTSTDLENYYKQALELQRNEEAKLILNLGAKSEAPLFFLLEKYRLLVEEGSASTAEAIAIRNALMQNDSTNEKGIQFSLALIDFQYRAAHHPLLFASQEVIQPLENYISNYGAQDPKNAWRVEMMIAQFYLESDESNTALRHAERALTLAPQERREEIERSVDYIRKQANFLVEVVE